MQGELALSKEWKRNGVAIHNRMVVCMKTSLKRSLKICEDYVSSTAFKLLQQCFRYYCELRANYRKNAAHRSIKTLLNQLQSLGG